MSDLYREPTRGNPVESAVVRIRDAEQNVVGAGFLITERQALTCAHVVLAALGRRSDTAAMPSPADTVTLDFPLVEGATSRIASVTAWSPKPTGATPDGLDYALLQFTDAPPAAARPLPLAEDTDLWEHSFRAMGFPEGYDVGVWARGVVLGSMAGGRVQIVAEGVGHTVAPGFSGGPVWDNLAGGVVGMIVVSDEQLETRAAGMTPIRAILKACPELSSQVTTPLELQPAGGPFNSNWHIERDEEREALAYLRSPGSPAVIWGPRSAGKSWLFQRLIARLPEEPGGPRHIVEIDLARYDPDVRNSIDRLLKRVALRLVDALELSRDLVKEAWDPDLDAGPQESIEWLLERRIFPQLQGQLVLALERADAIWGYDTQDTFFPLLRSWANMGNREPWSRLRLMLAVSTTPTRLSQGKNNSPFNIISPVDLRDLNAEQIRGMVRRYRLEVSADEFQSLMALTRGHPYLVRLALFEAAIQRRDLASILADTGPESAFGWHLQGYWNWLEDQGLLESLRAALNNLFTKLTAQQEDALHRAGLLEWSDTEKKYHVRYPLYEKYFRSRLCR